MKSDLVLELVIPQEEKALNFFKIEEGLMVFITWNVVLTSFINGVMCITREEGIIREINMVKTLQISLILYLPMNTYL